MHNDPRNILGLSQGGVDPAELKQRFDALRKHWLGLSADPQTYWAARDALNELHVAYRLVRAEPRGSAGAVLPPQAPPVSGDEAERVAYLTRRIQASLEGGLLRHSRRRALLIEGRRLGFNDFQTHLLVAQAQFGGRPLPISEPSSTYEARHGRTGARLAAAVLLGLGMFLAALRVSGV